MQAKHHVVVRSADGTEHTFERGDDLSKLSPREQRILLRHGHATGTTEEPEAAPAPTARKTRARKTAAKKGKS